MDTLVGLQAPRRLQGRDPGMLAGLPFGRGQVLGICGSSFFVDRPSIPPLVVHSFVGGR